MTSESVEAAARAWLLEINAINGDAREATATLNREREAAAAIALNLERLAVEADAARIAAETAESVCLTARETLAACEEAEAAGVKGHLPAVPSQGPSDGGSVDDEPLAAALHGGERPPHLPAAARRPNRVDRGRRRRWAARAPTSAVSGRPPSSDLIDAILADSIAAGSLEFPIDHPFWGTFTLEQDREIAAALSSLGYQVRRVRRMGR